MLDDLELLIDAPVHAAMKGCGLTSLHEQKVSGESTPPIKVGSRAARWPKYEVLLMQKAMIAGCTKPQRIELADYLLQSRKTVRLAREIYESGLAMIAAFIDANTKTQAA